MELELNLNSGKKIARRSIFIYTFLLVFFLTIFQKFLPNITLTSLFTPPQNVSVLDNILPKLQKIPNNYRLKKETELIAPSFASTNYDNAKAYVVVDYNTGQIITSKNLSERLPIASLTKIITAIVALDLATPNEHITISGNEVNEEPTIIGVVPGQKMTVEELLNAMLLTSANDAAQALRDGIDAKYGASIFEDAMNKKAKIVDLNDSYFTNPQGYDFKDNHSSVGDLAIATHYALSNYPLIEKIVSKDYQFYPANHLHKQYDLYNWNGLLGVYPGVSGMKIGNTDLAGYTTIVVAKRGDRKLIAVLLGAPGVRERDLWTSQLLDFSFQKVSNLPPVALTQDDLTKKYSTWKFWN